MRVFEVRFFSVTHDQTLREMSEMDLSQSASFRDVFDITDSLVCPKLLSMRFRPGHDAPPLKTYHGRGGRRQRGRRLSGGSGRPRVKPSKRVTVSRRDINDVTEHARGRGCGKVGIPRGVDR